jgi:hypothetical protein
LVEIKIVVVYPLIFLLVKLALILLVVIALVGIIFSIMKLIKSWSRNRIRDDWLNDYEL